MTSPRVAVMSAVFLLLSGVVRAQNATPQKPPASGEPGASGAVSVSATVTTPTSAPPLYLVDVLKVKAKSPASPDPQQPVKGNQPQTIEFPDIPPHSYGDPPFEISASSNSGLPVTFKVNSGRAKINGALVSLTGSGDVVIEASQDGDGTFAPAEPKPQKFSVYPGACMEKSPPKRAGSGDASKTDAPNLQAIIAALGNPSPFSLQASGDDTLLLYSSHYPLIDRDIRLQQSLVHQIQQISGVASVTLNAVVKIENPRDPESPPAFKVTLLIPHATSLGDLTSRFGNLNSKFTVQDVGAGKLLITSKTAPDCQELTEFLTNIRDVAWKLKEQPFVSRLFYLNASDVTSALSSAAGSASASSSGQKSQNSSPDGGSSSQSQSASSAGSQQGAGAGSTAKTSTGNTSKDSGSGASNSANDGSADGSGSQKSAVKPAGDSPSPSPPPPPASVSPVNPDFLVFADSSPGNDISIYEHNRTIAQLDLPRPVVVLTAWSLQTSSSDADSVTNVTRKLKQVVLDHNESLQRSIERGWESIKQQLKDDQEEFFDALLFNYITKRFIADQRAPSAAGGDQGRAQDFLEYRAAPGSPVHTMDSDQRSQFNACGADSYCLGYTQLFQPLRPRLTDLILAIISASDPSCVLNEVWNILRIRRVSIRWAS